MALTSMEFLILVGIAVAGYYLIPKKYQWMWLLGFSYLYYVSGGVKLLGYLLFTTLTTYGAGIFLEKTEEKGRRKGILILTPFIRFNPWDIFWMCTGREERQKKILSGLRCL